MNSAVVTVAIEDMSVEPLGVKEAVLMALEPLGGVRLLEISVRGPEQMSVDGVAPPKRPAPASRRPEKTKPGGQAPRGRPAPYVPREMESCLNCAYYRSDPGRDEAGNPFYGKCVNTGAPVYRLMDRCRGWKRVEQR